MALFCTLSLYLTVLSPSQVEFERAVLAIREYVMSHRDGPDEEDNEEEEKEEKVPGTPLNSTPTLIEKLPQ